MKGKLILLFLGIVVVVVAVALFFLFQNLDSIVKAAIEKYGSEAAGTAVRVESVEIGLKEGRGAVNGLTVANPPGFSSDPIFSLGEIALDIDTATVTSDLPVVEEIRIGATSFLFEVNKKAGTNLDVLKQNLKLHGAGGKAEQTGGEGAPLRLLVKRLSIAGGEGTLDLTAVGGKRLEGKLPPVTLTDLGGSQGITPAALGETVLAALVKNLEKTAAREGVEKAIRDKLGGEAGRLEEKLDEKLGPGASDALKNMLGK